MRPALPAALLLAAACGEPIDPLAELAAARAAWPEPEQATSNAVVRVGPALGERLVAELVDRHPFASPPGPFGMRLIVLAEVEQAALHLSGGGEQPVTLGLDVSGLADLRTGLGGPSDLPWTATVGADLVLGDDASSEGLDVSLGLPDLDAMTVGVELTGLDGGAAAMAGGAVAGAIEQTLRDQLADPVHLRIPPGPATPRDLDVRTADGGLVLDVSLPALGPTSAPPLPPDPGDGFVAVIPEDTLLAWGRAVASTQLPVGAAVFEPERVDVRDGGLVVEVKVHKTARRERWRRYRASVALGLADGHLTASVSDLELLDKHSWAGGPTASLAESAAPNRLAQLAEQVPTVHTATLGPKRAIELRATTLELVDDALFLRGSARIVSTPESDPQP